MATDTDVQFFSHLNGLTLSNNWGDMCNLLDACLVDGVQLTSVTAASIDAQGDINLSLYAAHNCILFQVIELSGFADVVVDGSTKTINGKYRIKGTPSTTQLILKGNVARSGTDPATINLSSLGTAKLASLGYDKVFTAQYKRVYRAKNPTAQHPFIRVDETLSGEGGGNYTSTYAKYAMVGLIENMTHIDDYEDPNKLQLPLDTTDFTKNWKITGTGENVVRGWSRWYWSRAGSNMFNGIADSSTPTNVNHTFTLCGDKDAFYFLNDAYSGNQYKSIKGCGLYNQSLDNSVIPNWFLMSIIKTEAASHNYQDNNCVGGLCLTADSTDAASAQCFATSKYLSSVRLSNHIKTQAVTPSPLTGVNSIYSGTDVPALEYPIYDTDKILRGSLKHIYFCGKNLSAPSATTVVAADTSMYIYDGVVIVSNSNIYKGGIYFYLGELE